MQNRGFKNEKKLIKALHNHCIEALNPNLQRLILKTFHTTTGTIKCKAVKGNHKSDIEISIGKEKHSYSIKMGKANSIHQESLHKFIQFLEREHKLKEPIKSYIQEFIWADGTINGLGKVTERISSRTFKKKHPDKIKAIQNYFNTLSTALIERFLITGVSNHTPAEYLYYGTVKQGYVCSTKDALQWLVQKKGRGVLSIGKLNFQAWNRNLKGKPKSEHKRGFIQIKWGGLKKEIQKIIEQNATLYLTPYHFQKLFTHNLLASGASLYHKKAHKLFLNQRVLKHWGVSEQAFLHHYQEKLKIPIDALDKVGCQACLKRIKKYAKKEILREIKQHIKIQKKETQMNYYWVPIYEVLSRSKMKQLQIRSCREPKVAIVLDYV